MKKILHTNEFYLAIIIFILSIIINLKSGAFFTLGNLFDLLRSGTVMGIFVIAEMIVIISGGIDISFPAIASFSMYLTTKILVSNNYSGSIIFAFLIAGIIGLLLGLINAIFISIFKLPTFIVTLGTSSMFSGFLLAFIGSREISNIPDVMTSFSRMTIFKVKSSTGVISSLPYSFLIFVVIAIFVWILLKYTMLGRGIYAIGGDINAAERAGFNVKLIQIFIYGFVGFISGIGGFIHTCMMQNSNPVNLLGLELIVIAAVVLGGTKITGGYGTVIGALLGLFLVIIMNNSLILLGIPSYWQTFVTGVLILIGTSVTAHQGKNTKSNLSYLNENLSET
ncbi:MAG: ABC transporter permease [bacterium]